MIKFTRWVLAVLAGMALGTMASGNAFGMGFGRPVTQATLGDTLSVLVPVHLEAGESIDPECIRADVYYGEDKVAGQSVRAQWDGANGTTRDKAIRIRTVAAINEPVVTVYVVAGCQPRVTRKFVLLADPPEVRVPQVAREPEGKAPALAMVRDESSKTSILGARAASFSLSAPILSDQRGGADSTRAAADARHADTLQRPPSVALNAAKSASTSTKSATKGETQPEAKRAARRRDQREAQRDVNQGVARLVLDPVDLDARVVPGLQMTRGLTQPMADDAAVSPEVAKRRKEAAAIWQAMNTTPEQWVRDRERLQDLERKLDALMADSAKAREAVGGLQTRVKQHDQQLASQPAWTSALAVLALVLAGVLIWREWTLRKTLAEHAAWWPSQLPEHADDESHWQGASVHPADYEEDAHEDPHPLRTSAGSSRAVASVPAHSVAPESSGHEPVASRMPAASSERKETLRDVSVDELIDLEQQAEFFVVLGQDDAAIEVLETYVHTSKAVSPMPFLKLLEIYRRLGLRSAYERTRMNFNLRFNAHAPAWESDLSHGHELADYPGVLERLQALWKQPKQALEVLEHSLMRQDNESYTFDLPAYRELLFLYSIARDLSERNEWPASTGGEYAPAYGGAPLMATLPMKALPELAPTLSLDLELDGLYTADTAPGVIPASEIEHVPLPVISIHKP